MSVKTFLKNVQNTLNNTNAKGQAIRFVTGNQSADLDSVVSALSFSYFNYIFDSTISVPLINIPKTDFKLRRDIKMVLENQQITEDQLYFVEDFRSITKDHDKVEITLVDHCNIQGETLLEYLQQDKLIVKSIIDHHEDENVFLDANPRIIKPNGSCSSLVFNYWDQKLNHDDKLLKGSDNDIIKLVLAPLVIDTSNMTSKVESEDMVALNRYKQLLNINAQTDNQVINIENEGGEESSFIEQYFNSIKQAKKDLEGFKFSEILRKDYKQFQFNHINVGFSSIGKSCHWLFKKYSNDDILSGIEELFEFYRLDALIITPSFSDNQGNFTRELILTYNKECSFKSQLDSLQHKVTSLQLNSNVYHQDKFTDRIEQLNSVKEFKVFNQLNLAASRKQIVPAVKHALELD